MKKKNVIIILLIVLLYGFIMFTLFYNRNDEKINNEDIIYYKSENAKYLVISNTSNFMYKDNKWFKVNNNSIENKNLYKIYDDNNYLGEYKLQYATNWNIFDDNNEYINYNGKLFAYSNNFDIKLIRFNVSNITDDDKKIVVNKYGERLFSNLITNEVVNVDLDNNGVIDKIICLSSNDIELNNNNAFYNLVFIILNGNYYTIIDQNSSNSNIDESPIYNISRLFNFDNEYYLVVDQTYGIESDSVNTTNYLYKFSNDKFINVLNN